MRWRWLIVLVSLLGCVASGSMISPHVQSLVDPGLSYTQIVARPETHVG